MIIKNLPKDSQIQFISELFKYEHLKTWNLRLCIKADEKNVFRHTRLSNLPTIAKRRYINPSNGIVRSAGYPVELKKTSTSNWKVEKDKEGDNYSFVLDYNISIDYKRTNIKIYIPQIEFARALFFHNSYLARNCIDNGILSREFYITNNSDGLSIINVLPICTLSVTQLNNEGLRRLLAWILVDKNARASYDSISKNFTENAKTKNGIKTWKFKFAPPNLTDFDLSLTGWLDKKTNHYYVYEITSVQNVNCDLPKKVFFNSDKFKTGTQSGGTRSTGGYSSSNDEVIDDTQEADIDSRLKNIDIPKTLFSFAQPIETRKVVKRKSKGRTGADAENTDEFVELEFSADEAIVGGTACQADFAGLEDGSDVIELYMQRFEAFKFLIKKFDEKYQVHCEQQLHFLPAVNKSKCHKTIDGNKRALLEVQVTTENAKFVILELDTSDKNRALSTLVIEVDDFIHWRTRIDKLMTTIVSKSLHWPTENNLEKYGKTKSINHPKDMWELLEDSIDFERWLNRLAVALRVEN